MKVIGIRELYLTVDLLELDRGYSSLYRGTSAYVHKPGGLYIPMYGMENASARSAILR